MPLIVKEEKNNNPIELPSQNNHVAVCIGVWDVGKQKTNYNNEVKIAHKVLIRWEIDEEITQEGDYQGKKKCVNKFYTLSFHPKSRLRMDVESWIGTLHDDVIMTGFDLENLIGQPCMLNVIHNESNGKTYANVMTISKLPKGLQPFETDNLDIYREKEPEFVQKIRDNFAATLVEEEKAPF